MSRLIDADDPKLRGELKFIREAEGQIYGIASWCFSAKCEAAIDDVPTVDAVPVVRCKDCKHRPTGDEMEDLEFPDNRCPCRCEDYWYSWKPSDDWFCPYGERKDGE